VGWCGGGGGGGGPAGPPPTPAAPPPPPPPRPPPPAPPPPPPPAPRQASVTDSISDLLESEWQWCAHRHRARTVERAQTSRSRCPNTPPSPPPTTTTGGCAERGVAHIKVDGASPEYRELRTRLFTLSGRTAHYPQVFRRPITDGVTTASPSAAGIPFTPPTPTDEFAYVGDWDAVLALNESNETRGTFDAAFAGCERTPPGQALLGTLIAGIVTSPSRSGAVRAGSAFAADPAAPAASGAGRSGSAGVAAPAAPSSSSGGGGGGGGSVWVKCATPDGEEYW
jgi:hypothetical protein